MPTAGRSRAKAPVRRRGHGIASVRPRVAALVPATGIEDEVAPCVRSLRAEGVDDVRVVTWDEPSPGAPRGDARAIRPRTAWQTSFGRAMNRALDGVTADVVLFAVPAVRPRRGLLAAYLERLRSAGAGVVYGDYEVIGPGATRAARLPLATVEDLSESSGFGFLYALRRDVLAAVGGWDESLRYVEDYDLRLRLGEVTTFAHAHGARYDVVTPDGGRTAPSRYFPGEEGAPAGFGYLFLEREVECEIDRAFRACLERRGALLTGACESFVCPHRDARPTVSVVIPTLDRAQMLERAITTVREGTFGDVEILVVDNGSTDGTIAMLEEIGRRDPRVVLLRNPRPSIASALNLGVRSARGKYVSQLDSDDEYLPATLASQVAHLEANPTWGLAVSYYDVIDDRGCTLPQYGVVRHPEYDRNTILRTGGAGAVRTWHRCVIEELGGFDEGSLASYGEDYDLVLRACERFEVGRVHELLYRVRLHATNTDKRLDYRFRAMRKAEARRRALERRQAANRRALARGA